eukprot:symbB.v1.2.019684.t1/scaffold1621.1/size109116/3
MGAWIALQVAASRRSHYEVKVERLRQEVQKAREGLGTAALAPERGSSTGILSKSLNQRKTNNYDLKQGQLCRNEEKLTRMTEVQREALVAFSFLLVVAVNAIGKLEEAHAASLRSLLVCVTFGRRKLQQLVDEILRSCIDELLPSIHTKCSWAQEKAPPPKRDTRTTGFKPRQRTLEDVTDDGQLSVGDIVSVMGLSAAAQYNGENGTVRQIRPDGRIEVELVLEGVPGEGGAGEGNKILAVKPENLRRVCPAALPTQCSGLLVQGAEALVLEDWDPRNVRNHEDSDDTLAEGRRATVCLDRNGPPVQILNRPKGVLPLESRNSDERERERIHHRSDGRSGSEKRKEPDSADQHRSTSTKGTSKKDKEAPIPAPRPSLSAPFNRCRFMDENWRICNDQVLLLLTETSDFLVVASLGSPKVGRSTVLSTLLSPFFYDHGVSSTSFQAPLGIHSSESFLEGGPSGPGVDLCITMAGSLDSIPKHLRRSDQLGTLGFC